MARQTNKLTANQIKNEAPGAADIKRYDGGGMYLLIRPEEKGGHKWWRFDYRFADKRKTLSLGVYPDVSLKEARERRDDARSRA